MEQLRYTSESDRAYGAAGMAMGLVIYDGEEMLASICIDSDPDGNPGVSAKSAWNQNLKNYNLGISMLISNVMCRYMVSRSSSVPAELKDILHELALGEGRESCQLDEDEIDRLFDKNYSYLTRVFSHRGVQSVAHDFASTLISRRTLSRHEVIEQLSALNML